jgi:hypothetical protein
MPTDLPPLHHRLADDHHPTPFSAAQIRDACAPGRRSTYRVTAGEAVPYLDVWWFEAGDAAGADMVHLRTTAAGTPLGAPERSRASWEELQAHASYPVATTTVDTEAVTTPVGRFEAWRYTTVAGDGVATRAWFARNLPGPPVLIVSERGGAEVFRYELTAVERAETGSPRNQASAQDEADA